MKKIVSAFLALIMLFSAVSVSFSGYAAEKRYVGNVLAQIQTQTGFIPGETSAVVGNCYGFISAVCEKLYGVKYQEGLNSDGYTCKHNTGYYYTVKTYKTTESDTSKTVEDIISFFVNNAYPGDIVHYASLSGSSHTVMIQSIDNEKMTFFHSNYSTRTLPSSACHIDTIYWSSFRSNPTQTIYNSDGTMYSNNALFYNKQKRGGIGITINRFTDYEKYFYPKYIPPVLSVSRASCTSVKLSWNAVSGASKYRVEYKRSSESSYIVLSYGTTSTSYTVSGLTVGVKYDFRVAAYAGNKWQDYSNVVTKKALPPTVTSLSFTPGSTGLVLKWGKKTDLSGVRVYKATTNEQPSSAYKTLDKSANSLLDTNIKYGVTYYYWVQRYVVVNGKEYSTTSKAFAGAYVLKTPVVTYTRSNATSITFTFNGDNCQDSFDYYLVSDSNKQQTATVNTTQKELTLEKLTLGEHYTVYVREKTAVAAGSYGSLTVQAAPVPVSGITALPKLKGIRVDYNTQNDCDGYVIYRSDGGQYAKIAKLSGKTKDYYLDKTVKYGVTYTYIVNSYALDSKGNEIIGDTGTPSGSVAEVIAAPTGVKAQRTSPTKIKLSWNAVGNVTGYVLQYKQKGGKWTTVTGLKKTSRTVKNLSTGKKYYFRVRGVNYVGNGSFSKKLGVKALPPAPKAPKLTDSGSYIKVSFKTKSYASGYCIYRATSPGGKYKQIGKVEGNKTKSYKDYAVTNGRTYYYKIACYMKVDGKICKSPKSEYSSLYYS